MHSYVMQFWWNQLCCLWTCSWEVIRKLVFINWKDCCLCIKAMANRVGRRSVLFNLDAFIDQQFKDLLWNFIIYFNRSLEPSHIFWRMFGYFIWFWNSWNTELQINVSVNMNVIFFIKHMLYILNSNVNNLSVISGFHSIQFEFKATSFNPFTFQGWELYVKFNFGLVFFLIWSNILFSRRFNKIQLVLSWDLFCLNLDRYIAILH